MIPGFLLVTYEKGKYASTIKAATAIPATISIVNAPYCEGLCKSKKTFPSDFLRSLPKEFMVIKHTKKDRRHGTKYILRNNIDGLVKSRISPPLVGGD